MIEEFKSGLNDMQKKRRYKNAMKLFSRLDAI